MRAMIRLMQNRGEIWERRSIELPPGWHDVLTELSRLSGVKLKYLYSVAINQMLTDADFDQIVKAAWDLHRQTGEDITRVGACHRPDTVQKWHQNRDRAQAKHATRQRSKRSGGRD